jgi:alpha-galactosidase
MTRDCSRYPELDHFPNGMAEVVDYVHSKGLMFGLYTCAGTKTCVGGRPGSKVGDELGDLAASCASTAISFVIA